MRPRSPFFGLLNAKHAETGDENVSCASRILGFESSCLGEPKKLQAKLQLELKKHFQSRWALVGMPCFFASLSSLGALMATKWFFVSGHENR